MLKKSDMGFAASFITLALILFWDASRLAKRIAQEMVSEEIFGPDKWMILIGCLLLICGLILGAFSLSTKKQKEEVDQNAVRGNFWQEAVLIIKILSSICLYLIALTVFGYLLSTISFMVVYLYYISRYSFKTSLLAGFAIGITFHLLFINMAKIPLSQGILFN